MGDQNGLEETIPDEGLTERLKQVEALLDEYEKKIYLSKITCTEPDLDVGREVMLKMSVEDLHGLQWDYSRYALFLQKEENRHQSRYNWADANLRRFVEKHAHLYEGFKWEQRQSEALNCNEYAQKLFQLKVKSKLAIDRLAYIPAKLKVLSDIARSAAYTKGKFTDGN